MRNGDRAELRVKKKLRIGESFVNKEYSCRVLCLHEKEESIYLVLEQDNLKELSLDCIYECRVYSEKALIKCTGRIKERYRGENGNTIKFLIENGFYKINLKSVDKQIV